MFTFVLFIAAIAGKMSKQSLHFEFLMIKSSIFAGLALSLLGDTFIHLLPEIIENTASPAPTVSTTLRVRMGHFSNVIELSV